MLSAKRIDRMVYVRRRADMNRVISNFVSQHLNNLMADYQYSYINFYIYYISDS
jgi:hypothetical protein